MEKDCNFKTDMFTSVAIFCVKYEENMSRSAARRNTAQMYFI